MTMRVTVSVPAEELKAAAVTTYDRNSVTPTGGRILQPGQAETFGIHAGTELRIGETEAQAAEPAAANDGGPELPGAGGVQVGDNPA